MEAIRGLSKIKRYAYGYLKYLGFIAVFAYFVSNAFRILKRWRYMITDKVPILLPTKAGVLSCTFEDLSVIWEIFCERVYRFSMRPNVVIDIGAHIGIFSLYVKKVSPKSRVIAIEPHPLNLRFLKLNMRLNNLVDIIVVPFALHSSRGDTTLITSLGWRGLSTTKLEFAKHPTRYIKVPAITLDDLTKSTHITSIDLVKVDVEGAELDVLKGGKRTLTKTRELVIATYHTPTEADEIEAFLKKLGFRVHRYSVMGATYIYAVNTSLNRA